jgi:hypothetical protein
VPVLQKTRALYKVKYEVLHKSTANYRQPLKLSEVLICYPVLQDSVHKASIVLHMFSEVQAQVIHACRVYKHALLSIVCSVGDCHALMWPSEYTGNLSIGGCSAQDFHSGSMSKTAMYLLHCCLLLLQPGENGLLQLSWWV